MFLSAPLRLQKSESESSRSAIRRSLHARPLDAITSLADPEPGRGHFAEQVGDTSPGGSGHVGGAVVDSPTARLRVCRLPAPMSPTWSNWGRQPDVRTCRDRAARQQAGGRRARREGGGRRISRRARVRGGPASFTPVVETDGLLLDLSALNGVTDVDPIANARRRWLDADQGLLRAALVQGPGAAQPGRHRRPAHRRARPRPPPTAPGIRNVALLGLRQRRVRLVTANGEIRRDRRVRAAPPARRAGIDRDARGDDRAGARRRRPPTASPSDIGQWSLGAGDRPLATSSSHEHCHLRFFWMPTEASGALYNLESHGQTFADRCYVKIYDEPTPTMPPTPDVVDHRTDRCYRIYPMVDSPNFHELEYFVPLERGRRCAQRDARADARLPARRGVPARGPHPSAADDCVPVAQLRHRDDRDLGLRHARHRLLGRTCARSTRCSAQFDARVHWGKLHFLTRERLQALYPEAGEFIAVRRALDPDGRFLNDHLRPLLGITEGRRKSETLMEPPSHSSPPLTR